MPTRSKPTRPRTSAPRRAVPALGRAADRSGRLLRHRSRHLPSRRRPRRAPAPDRVGTEQAAKEAEWLPRLAPHLPLAVPVQLALGDPAEGYPFTWSVYEWLPGDNANGPIADLDQAAVDLAAFVKALRRVDATVAHSRPPRGRGAPLESWTSRSVDRSPSSATAPRAMPPSARGRNRSAPRSGTATRSGCMATCCPATCSSSTAASRRIDFGGLNVGDPA